MDHYFRTPKVGAIYRPHLSWTFYVKILEKSFINAPSKVLRWGSEEINRTTLQTPHLELLQLLQLAQMCYWCHWNTQRRKRWKKKSDSSNSQCSRAWKQSPDSISHFPTSCIPSNSRSVLYNMVNVDMCCKHLGLEVTSSTQGSWSHASPRTPGEQSRAQHAEVKEFTAPPTADLLL